MGRLPAAPETAAAKGDRHIAEQRIGADRPEPDATTPDVASKDKPRRATPGEITKADNVKLRDSGAGGRSVPGARSSTYAEEAAELLAGLSASRRRRKTGPGLPAPNPAGQEPPAKASRVTRKGDGVPHAKD